MTYTCYIDRLPSGRWGYVGTKPIALAELVPHTAADAMAGRLIKLPDGTFRSYRFPTFATREEAEMYAFNKGIRRDGARLLA